MADVVSGELAALLRATTFAAQRHWDKRRKGVDALPYVNHLLDVASILANVGGVTDAATLVAAILHDTIEDTPTTAEELEAAFGREVRLLVEEVTDDKKLEPELRKRLQIERAPTLSPKAKRIKLGDKISNVAEVFASPPKDWTLARRREYLDWAERVVAGCRGANEALERRFDEVLRQGREVLARES